MLHCIKSDNGDGSSSILIFSTKDIAYKYAEHPNNIDYCHDGDGVAYEEINATPNPGFEFDDKLLNELDE